MGLRKENLNYYFTKHRLIWQHRNMRPKILKPIQKDIVNLKDQKTGTLGGYHGPINPRVTTKPDTPLEEIRKLVPNRTRNQQPRR